MTTRGERVGYWCRPCRAAFESKPDHRDSEHGGELEFQTDAQYLPVIYYAGAYYAMTNGGCAPGDHGEFEQVGGLEECVACGTIKFDRDPLRDTDGPSKWRSEATEQ